MFDILVIGDPHFKNDNTLETDLMHTEIIKLLISQPFKFVVILGDILHKHEKIDMFPYDRAIKFLKDIKDNCNKLYILIGNHDRPNNNDFLTDRHSFNSLKEWDNTIIVDNIIVDEIEEYKFCFAPYVPVGRFMEALNTNTVNLEEITMVFSHQEYDGCKINNISKSNADKWDIVYPLNIAGHIHDFEIVQKNLIYIGTPFQHSYSDTYDKTISIFSILSKTEIKHSRIDLNIPKKIEIVLTVDELLKYTPIENSKIKIKLQGHKSEIKSILLLTNIKEMIEKYNIIIIPIIIDDVNSSDTIETYNKMKLYDKIVSKLNTNLLEIFNEILYT